MSRLKIVREHGFYPTPVGGADLYGFAQLPLPLGRFFGENMVGKGFAMHHLLFSRYLEALFCSFVRL